MVQSERNMFYTFEQALDARFCIPMEDIKKINKIYSAVYTHENDFPLRLHSHNFYEINIISEGSGTHIIEKNTFPAQTGDVFVIPPHISHGYNESKNQHLKIIHILLSKDFMSLYGPYLKKVDGYSLLFNVEPNIRKNNNVKIFTSINNTEFVYYLHELSLLCELCMSEMAKGKNETYKNIKVLNLICDLAFSLSSDKYLSDKSVSAYVTELSRVISFIENNYAEDISLEDFCREANMSRSSLLKQFKALFNCSPSEYLLEVRIKNACKLLKSTDFSIAHIAQDCGFYDSSHFTKMFYKQKNVLPKDYKNNNKN